MSAWKLQSIGLLGGAGLSAELERLSSSTAWADQSEEIWRSVELARHQERPYTLDYVGGSSTTGSSCTATACARTTRRSWPASDVSTPHGRRRRPAEGPRPEGTHGAQLRHGVPRGLPQGDARMELAERHRFPLLTLVDTPGLPGRGGREHGQGGASPARRRRWRGSPVPSIACVIGEGGSGGAVALALADRVLMQEHAIYSVPPEGCSHSLARRRRGRRLRRRSSRTPCTASSSSVDRCDRAGARGRAHRPRRGHPSAWRPRGGRRAAARPGGGGGGAAAAARSFPCARHLRPGSCLGLFVHTVHRVIRAGLPGLRYG